MASMEKVCGADRPFVNPAVVEDAHNKAMEETLESFDSTRKMGGSDFSTSYREKLETDILAAFDDFLKNNEAKNILNYTRTPFIYLTMGVIGYIASSFFGMLYLTSLSSIFYLLTVCSVVAISLWLYIRYAGEHHELSRWLELVADFIWENLMGQVYDSLVEKATHELSNKVMRDATGLGPGSKKKTS